MAVLVVGFWIGVAGDFPATADRVTVARAAGQMVAAAD